MNKATVDKDKEKIAEIENAIQKLQVGLKAYATVDQLKNRNSELDA